MLKRDKNLQKKVLEEFERNKRMIFINQEIRTETKKEEAEAKKRLAEEKKKKSKKVQKEKPKVKKLLRLF